MKALLLSLCLLPCLASAQHLYWRYDESKKYTCLYGEIEVLATGPTIYYCGCNWWPSAPAGGYCGIQDRGDSKLAIFSIWDTAPDLHPQVHNAEARTKFNRFGGEGSGAHTHLDFEWPLKKTFRYYVTKAQVAKDQTRCSMYFYDDGLKKWVHEASIDCPNGDAPSVATFGSMLNSFLENWGGRSVEIPKLAVYRLWIGTSPTGLTFVDKALGDGQWGILDGSFYLAGGDEAKVAPLFKAHERIEGKGEAISVPTRTISKETLRQLSLLPTSPVVK